MIQHLAAGLLRPLIPLRKERDFRLLSFSIDHW